jgi:N utilization substance protein B
MVLLELMVEQNNGLSALKPTVSSPASPGATRAREPGKLSHEWIRERRRARRLALQALFEIDVSRHRPGDVVDSRLADARAEEPAEFSHGAEFLRWLVSGVIEHKPALDKMIQGYAPDWPVDQLAVVDRNILRLAIFEMGSHDADTPPKVVINEAVELGKLFGSDSSPRFINGVLGSALDEAMRKPF